MSEARRQRESTSNPPARGSSGKHLLERAERYIRSEVEDALEPHHSAQELGLGESLEDFPDASFANRKPPYIAGQARRIKTNKSDLTRFEPSG